MNVLVLFFSLTFLGNAANTYWIMRENTLLDYVIIDFAEHMNYGSIAQI